MDEVMAQARKLSAIVYSRPGASDKEAGVPAAPLASIIVRTYNEARHLPDVLRAVTVQALPDGRSIEVIVVDSGSSDGTIDIAEKAGTKIVHIDKRNSSFGRSLNLGCAAASGK